LVYRCHKLKCRTVVVTGQEGNGNKDKAEGKAAKDAVEGKTVNDATEAKAVNDATAEKAISAPPPRTADLISLMRKQFSNAGPEEEEEDEDGTAGQTANSFDFGNKQGTGILVPFHVKITQHKEEVKFTFKIC